METVILAFRVNVRDFFFLFLGYGIPSIYVNRIPFSSCGNVS